MNLIEQSERLKGAPDNFLAQEAQAPSGFAPPYLILAEISRRQSLRQRGTTAKAPQTTVYDDLVGQAALPTMEALGRPGASPMPMPAPQRPPMQAQPPPGQQGPPATGIAAAVPMRYARGGPVRMAWGGGVYGSATGGYDYPFLREAFERQRQEEEARKQQLMMQAAGPAGAMVRGIPFPAVPAPAARNLPPLVAPRINEPQLSPVLEEIRGMRTPTAELTAPLEQRIAELEQQRSTIQRPSFKDALFETGLGMMASRAPTALGALGQAGLGALQNYRAEKQRARAEESDISRQIGATGAQIAGVRGRQEEQQFSDAMQRLQQLHGSEVVRAQTEDTTQRANRREQEEALDRMDRQAQQQYGHNYGVAMAQLERSLRQPTPEEREQAWQDYQRKQDYETKKNIEQIKATQRATGGAGSGMDAVTKRLLQQGSIDRSGRSLIMEQLQQGWVDPKLSPTGAIDQAQKAVRRNLEKFYPGMPAAERKLLSDSVGSFTANKEFLEEIRELQAGRRADLANKLVAPSGAPAAAAVDDLGLPPPTGKPARKLDLNPPPAGAAAAVPPRAQPMVAPPVTLPGRKIDITGSGIRVDPATYGGPVAAAGPSPREVGRMMYEYFQGADPDAPPSGLNPVSFAGYTPQQIQAYRDYLATERKKIRW
ncbi:MAG: hypothetical protein ABWY12_09700 [Burkholderiales bacterium]